MYRVLEATVAYATLICTFYYYYYYYYFSVNYATFSVILKQRLGLLTYKYGQN